MRVIIVGAGEVGNQLAKVLCHRKNDVIIIDLDDKILEQLKNQLDVMTLTGNGAAGQILVKAGIDKADMLFAVTNNSEANILTCVVAKNYNVRKKIARIKTNEYFDDAKGLKPEFFGIDHVIIPEYECATDILDALLRPAIRETVKFRHPDAQMVNFQIKPGSPLAGSALKNFPMPEFINKLRVCAILRYGQLIIPTGINKFNAYDEIYVSGDQTVIDELISRSEGDDKFISKVIIAGGTRLGGILASMLVTADIKVSLIEPDLVEAERVCDLLGTSTLIIHGESTDISILEEAGIEHCNAFIAARLDDESNLLSCVLARNHCAGKVIAVTDNPDYLRIISGLTTIDCCFSPLVSAVNILINYIKTENRQTVAMLKRIPAEMMELIVPAESPIANQKIKDISLPAKMIFSLIIRNNHLVPAIGDETIKPNDSVLVLTEPESVETVGKWIDPKGFFA